MKTRSAYEQRPDSRLPTPHSLLFLCSLLFVFTVCENPIMAKLLEPLAPHIHNWGEWTVITEPTCTTEGEEIRVCNLDPTHEETRPIAALGHDWSEWTVITEPTCTTEGEEIRVCNLDPTHEETRTITALGHDWSEWIVTKEPTKTEEGEETRTCAHDSTHKETRPIPRISEAGISISFTQIAEGSPSLGGPVVIYRSSANGRTSYDFTLENPEQYTVINWYVYSVTGSGGTFTLDSSNISYNMIGTHVLTLEVVKGGLLYTTVITFEVRQ